LVICPLAAGNYAASTVSSLRSGLKRVMLRSSMIRLKVGTTLQQEMIGDDAGIEEHILESGGLRIRRTVDVTSERDRTSRIVLRDP